MRPNLNVPSLHKFGTSLVKVYCAKITTNLNSSYVRLPRYSQPMPIVNICADRREFSVSRPVVPCRAVINMATLHQLVCLIHPLLCRVLSNPAMKYIKLNVFHVINVSDSLTISVYSCTFFVAVLSKLRSQLNRSRGIAAR